MEDLELEVIEELRKKEIERSDDDDIQVNEIEEELLEEATPLELPPVEQPKKSKKQRSQKQIEAFEKARIKRAENLKIKKQIEEEKKEAKKAEKEQVKKEVKQRLIEKEQPSIDVYQPGKVEQVRKEPQPKYKEQVIHNYYYYGFSPQQVAQQGLHPPPSQVSFYDDSPKPKKRIYDKKKKIKSPSPEIQSSDSEAEEPQSYKELQNYAEDYAGDYESTVVEQEKLKFRFR